MWLKKKKKISFLHYIPNEKPFQFCFILRVTGKKAPSFVKVGAHFCTIYPQSPEWQSWSSDSRPGVTSWGRAGTSPRAPRAGGCRTPSSFLSLPPTRVHISGSQSHPHTPKAALHFTSVPSPPMHINMNSFSSPIPIMIYLQSIYSDTSAEGNAYKPHSCCTRINF